MTYKIIARPGQSTIQTQQPVKAYPGEESILGSLGRNIVRTGARLAEQAPTAAISSLTGSALGLVPAAAQGIANVLGIEEAPGQPARVPFTPSWLQEKVTTPLLGETARARGAGEESFDEITNTAAALLSGTDASKIAQAPLKALSSAFGRSTAAELAKMGTETLTGSPLAASGVKLGTLIATGLYGGRKDLEKERMNLYKEAYAKVPEKATIRAPQEAAKLDKLIHEISRGDRKDKDFLLERFGAIKNIIPKRTLSTQETTSLFDEFGKPIIKNIPGKAAAGINIPELITIKQNLNDYLFDPKITKATRDKLLEGAKLVHKMIQDYGNKNPEFYDLYKRADELHGALKSTNWVQNIIGSSPLLSSEASKNPIIKGLLLHGVGGYASKKLIQNFPILSTGAAGLYGGYQGAQLAALMAKSPLARRHYAALFKNAAQGNANAMLRDIKALNKEAERQPKGYRIIKR